MAMPSQAVERLLRMGRAGWANIPGPGLIGGFMVPAGIGLILVERGTGCVIVSSVGTPVERPQKVQFSRAIRIDRGRFRQHVSVFENNVSYMYLDIDGNVTIGLGHLLRDANAAKRLPFLERGTTKPAHPAHVENAFNKVFNSGLANANHTVFKSMTQIDLDLAAIETLFDADVDETLRQLTNTNRFPDYETYPASVQLGMLDLAYNMGTKGFFDAFKVFVKALEDRNWIEVANQSCRTEVDKNSNVIGKVKARNDVVQGWFREAITEEPFFLNRNCPAKRLPMMPG